MDAQSLSFAPKFHLFQPHILHFSYKNSHTINK